MKKKPYISRTTGSGSTVQLYRCQGVNTTDYRKGKQCGNAVSKLYGHCKYHKPEPKKCSVCQEPVDNHVNEVAPGLVFIVGFDQPVDCLWLVNTLLENGKISLSDVLG